MRILFHIGHPAHVHLFANAIHILQKHGHECKITAIRKEVSLDLLKSHLLDYEIISASSSKSSLISKGLKQIEVEYKVYKIAKYFKPDVLIGGPGGLSASHVGKLLGKASIIFDDTEHSKIELFLMKPFATTICTPSCYRLNLGKKQIRYRGYHELAYLHPNRFTPNPEVLKELGLTVDDRFTVVRFVSWNASHDIGCTGLTMDIKRKVVHELSKYGRVLISSEKSLHEEFEQYRFSLSPEKMHDLLYYATLFYGESATMASECAVLGTHSIFCDFAGRGYTDEEEIKYDLVYNFNLDIDNQMNSINKAIELLNNPYLKQSGMQKRNLLLQDKIDVTEFMVKLVERENKHMFY